MSKKVTTVFLIEDSKLTRTAVSAILKSANTFKVVGEAAEGEHAVREVLAKQPDVVIVDIGLVGGMNGIEVTRRIKKERPQTRALMLTSHDSDDELFESFAAGADGYILKNSFAKNRLLLALETVALSQTWLDPSIAKRVLEVAVQAPRTRSSASGETQTLSESDRQALEVVAAQEECDEGLCQVEPEFFERLHSLGKRTKK